MSIRKIIDRGEDTFDRIRYAVKEQLQWFDPVIIYPYRGYGTPKRALLRGRVLEREDVLHNDESEQDGGLWHNLHKLWKRYESDELPGVLVEGELAGLVARTRSDAEGYFTLEFEGLQEKQLANGWHRVKLRIREMPFDLDYEEEADGELLICDERCDFGIISDVDDTIMRSHATNPLQKLKTMLRHSAEERLAFEGVTELYGQLMQQSRNPLFFISGSSYNLYDLLTRFCAEKEIPKAPFLLRRLGLDAQQWIKEDTRPYKKEQVQELLNLFEHTSFICIGDSGQQDPEIYRELQREFPGRIKAIYIRHVLGEERAAELEKMAEELSIPLLLMDHSREALQHARKMDWLS